MPTYDYICEVEGCAVQGAFELNRPVRLHDTPAACPDCGELCQRIFKMPFVAKLKPGVRNAIERNIKSRYEPNVYSSSGENKHGVKPPSHRPKKPRKVSSSPRPWVIESK
ncbi:MAG: FmdB family zinc ribbon protein [Verrucomicrobiota bacterium]